MKLLLAGALLLGGGAAAWAQDWSSLDARTRSLGGAGVAFADGRADSLYWNPASLAVGSERPLDFSTGFSSSFSVYADAHVVGTVTSDIYHIVDQYEFYNFRDVQQQFNSSSAPAFTEADVQNAMDIVNSLSSLNHPGEGVLFDAGAGFNLRVGPFGLFVHGLGNVGVTPVVDLSGVSLTSSPGTFYPQLGAITTGTLSAAGANLSTALQSAGLSAANANNLALQAQKSLGDAAISNPAFISALSGLVSSTGPNSLYDNPSGVIVRGLAQVEAGISFSLPLLPTLLDVGISIKDVISETSFARVTYSDKDSADDVQQDVKDELKANRVRSSDFNVDLGVRVTPLEWLSLGLAARNVLPMNVDFAGPGGKLHLDPNVRFGAMVNPISFLKLGVDVDLVENESPVLVGYTMRHLGAGLEFDFPVFKLRLGYDDNLAFSKDHGRLTAGIGLDFFGCLVFDVGLQASLVDTVIAPASLDGGSDEKTVPSDRVSVGFSFGVNLPF